MSIENGRHGQLHGAIALVFAPLAAGAVLLATGAIPPAVLAMLGVVSAGGAVWAFTLAGAVQRQLAKADEDRSAARGALAEAQSQLQAASQDAQKDLRVRRALEAVTSNVMIADANNDVVFMNPSVTSMLRTAEADLRKALPNFQTDKVIGSSIDIFHKNPAHQKNMLAALRDTHRTTIEVGGRHFALVATPINDAGGKRLGTVVEWVDRTEALATERRIAEQTERALRAQSALEAVTSNVMIADANNDVVFMNKAVTGMLERAETDLRKALPNFETRKVIGSSIDLFHKNPAHQRSMLSALRDVHRT